MGPISKILSFLLEPAVSAMNVDTIHTQPDELQSIVAMPIDNAILTNVLTEAMEGKELQLYSASGSPQRITTDSPTNKAKRPSKLIILSKFLTRLVSSLMLLFSRKPVQGTENETKTAIHWAKQLFMKDLAEKQVSSTPLLTAPQTVEKPKRFPPSPKIEQYGKTHRFWVHMNAGLWQEGSKAQKIAWRAEIAEIFNDAWRTSLPLDEAVVLTTHDFKAIVATIKKLRNKVGLAELAVAILLALVVDNKLYKQSGCGSASKFFLRYSETMGISASRARDYCKRGFTFLDYRKDFLEGVGSIPGIPIDEFASSYMSKLTIYDAAVRKFGREQALYKLKTLSFRDFKEELKVKKPKVKNVPNNAQAHKSSDGLPCVVYNAHEEQKAMIEALNLSPSEKRLLQIIAKNGNAFPIHRLTDEQREQLEIRLNKWRVEYFERHLPYNSSLFERKSYDPANPLAISDDLYKLTDINDICLRIKAGLALIVPARRTIAILLNRLFTELPHSYKHPRPGVEYASFRDFAMEELGMGEEYRDYIAVGKVINGNPDVLYWLSDRDTEDVFFKLRYLLKALDTHKGNQCLVIARLRSLTVREFKLFSETSDFEITFSKKLTKKQLDLFKEDLWGSRNKDRMNHPCDYIEVYSESEKPWVLKFESIVEGVEKE
jgi:hypothetical protein